MNLSSKPVHTDYLRWVGMFMLAAAAYYSASLIGWLAKIWIWYQLDLLRPDTNPSGAWSWFLMQAGYLLLAPIVFLGIHMLVLAAGLLRFRVLGLYGVATASACSALLCVFLMATIDRATLGRSGMANSELYTVALFGVAIVTSAVTLNVFTKRIRRLMPNTFERDDQ